MAEINTIEEIRERLRSPRPPFLELWATAPPDRSLCALISGDVGWLMFLRENGDAGFSTRNPDYSGSADEFIDYQLENGQHDQYPASWALPVSEVQRALEHFITHAEPAPWLTWHNDSGDGTVIGGRPDP
ncbi:Imm1 family immunity protein [Luteolibacter soli]|uniref:Imm1 family immunity protein n=1 Tax=Luteolibacter soli TaxID=3135280 RepID=A0ABU9ATT7_9BACT